MEDLLDLNWSNDKGKNVNSISSPSTSFSAFDSLARPSSSSANYYGQSSNSNGSNNSNGITRSISPAIPSKPSSSSNDAFSSLFDTAVGSSSNSTRNSSNNNMNNMTLQQRMDMQKAGGSMSNTPINAGVAQKTSADPWDFDMLTSAAPSAKSLPVPTIIKSTQARASSPFDDLADFASSSKLTTASKAPASNHVSNNEGDDILGLLGQPVSAVRKASPPPSSIHAPRPQRPTTSQLNTTSSSSPSSAVSSRPPSRPVPARTPSPPPHILGQLVMLGFSVQQAKLALAATLGGKQNGEWDLEGAMEILASDGAANAQMGRKDHSSTIKGYADGDDEDVDVGMRRKRQQDRSEKDRTRSRQQSSKTTSPPVKAQEQDSQPDLLAQASVFGSSMLKSANAYWKTSRAQIQKAVEENKFLQAQLASAAGGSGDSNGGGRRSTTPNSNGRPKWMTDEMLDDEKEGTQPSRGGSTSGSKNGTQQASFKDDDNEDDVLPRNLADRQAGPSKPNPRARPEVNLFADDAALPPHPPERRNGTATSGLMQQPASAVQAASRASLKAPEVEKKIYASPNRRKPAAASVPPAVAAPARSTRPPRSVINASAAVLSQSKALRTAGNEHFKLGRYGEATESYTKALNLLPELHLARIPILNNRANARLKNGEEKRAAEDASAVLGIMLGESLNVETAKKEDYQAVLVELESMSAAEGGEEGGEKLDPYDALGKALSRRARGNEGIEKWRLAMLDWQLLTEMGDQRVLKSAGGIKVVSDGMARCRKVVEGGSVNRTASNGSFAPVVAVKSATPKPKPRPKPPALTSASTKPSAAVTALRQEAIQQELEDDQRAQLKDSVDSRITNWKGGKEANLRALIASLDSVLWPEAGWNKVGMHELITDNQLKIRYMKAIAKVHPDKISKDATVEQRMLADAVFSSLNEAWNVQK